MRYAIVMRNVSLAEKGRHGARQAADHFGVDVAETDWRQLGKRPHTKNSAH